MGGRAVTLRRSGYHQFLVCAIKSLQIISADISKNVCIQYSSGNFHIIIIIIIIMCDSYFFQFSSCRHEANFNRHSLWRWQPIDNYDTYFHFFYFLLKNLYFLFSETIITRLHLHTCINFLSDLFQCVLMFSYRLFLYS